MEKKRVVIGLSGGVDKQKKRIWNENDEWRQKVSVGKRNREVLCCDTGEKYKCTKFLP